LNPLYLTHIPRTSIQGNIKRDPQGYADEFGLQWRHYKASLQLFLLSPAQGSTEFQDLVTFLSHAVGCYPEETADFATDLMELLEKHGPLLDPSLRTSLVKALILLRNKRQLGASELLPLLFKLFRLQDKALRQLVFRHVTSDIKAANKNGRANNLNRSTQSFLYSVLADEHEGTAKRGLAVLIEMWRRHVWRDARTVNVIASAVFHKSPRVMLASLKFFLGQDIAEDEGDSDNDDNEGEKKITAGPSKEDVYKAFIKGTVSSKKKKQKKLQRAMLAVRKAQKKEEGGGGQASFAALQLLHDPQGFAEKLLVRLRTGNERFETRLAMMTVLSRAIGVHKLLVLNFYPFLQKYIAPSQKEVTTVLAALVQGCHEVVPPDVLAPVLRQLVDQFVHDKARPEVMTVGIKTVREICIRAPLVMTPELLQDLVEYKKFRDKEVSTAARGLLGLFRELAPGMLKKRDRGRGADGGILVPGEYGQARIADTIEGLDLLEEARRAGKLGPDGEVLSEGEDVSDEEEEESEEESEGEDGSLEIGSDEEEEELEFGEQEGSDESGEEDEENEENEEEEEGEEEDEEEEEEVVVAAAVDTKKRARPAAKEDSLATLKKQLAAKKAAANPAPITNENEEDWGRILTQEDFESIRQLKHRRLVDAAMSKAGLKSASKRARLRETAEEEAEETMALQDQLGVLHEQRVDPSALLGKRRGRRDKEERMASIMAGREGREFGSKAALKKDKQGGLSNREKDRRKNLPLAARAGQVRRRLIKGRLKSKKNFKGHVRKG
jgi:protein SDA1